jgi:DNA modification methylase
MQNLSKLWARILMYNIIHGDCLDVMKSMEDNSIDFIITDPPYGLNFMGKKWDKEIPNQDIWAEALRICKPGSMLAAFGGSRTHHHLMMALERSGWEIRDVIMWLYGSGFPKSHNHFGFEGYGTALKPAYEPIIIAMKPLDGTFAQNAKKWGVAGINIDASRIEAKDQEKLSKNWDRETITDIRSGNYGNGNPSGINLTTTAGNGRWPANIILDEEAAEQLDQVTNNLHGAGHKRGAKRECEKKGLFALSGDGNRFGDSGGASRFFYCAKASSSERNKGLDKPCSHPTVKPITLMKYIIKLLAPPGNPTCLDPFAGSGSTLLAAKELGFNCIGIEKEKEYCSIAEKRLENAELNLFNYKNAR